MGPVTYLVIEFPGNKFKGEILPTLRDLVDAGTIRVIDLVLVKKDADGKVAAIELNALTELDVALAMAFTGIDVEVSGLLSYEDIETLGDALENNSSAGILLFEHLWASRFLSAVANADGRLVLMESVSPLVLAEALEAQAGV
jgi:uncharacterized membrane protein